MVIGLEPELSQIQPNIPLKGSVNRERPKIVFQALIDNLNLPISLRMVGKRHCQLNTLKLHQFSPKLGSKHRIPIRNQRSRHAMEFQDVLSKEISNLSCIIRM